MSPSAPISSNAAALNKDLCREEYSFDVPPNTMMRRTFPDLKLFDRTVSFQVSAKEVANMATCPSIHSTFLLQLKSWSSANVRAQDCPKQDSQVDGMGNLCFSYLLSPIWHLPGLSSLLMDCHKTLCCFFRDFDPCFANLCQHTVLVGRHMYLHLHWQAPGSGLY